MDKPNKGNTIKIKLNGEDQSYQDVPPQKDTEANVDPIPKVIKINSNLLESDVFSETAAAEESVDESFDWIIPESSENDIEEFKVVSSKSGKKTSLPKIASFSSNINIKKKNGRPLGSILISAAFAVLIGTTIGVVMLKLMVSTPSDKSVVTEPPVVTENTDTPDTKTTDSKNTSGVISQVSTYVIQGGVFTSEAGAQETSTSLASNGVPSQSVEMDGKHFLFLGVADSIEAAKALGAQYKENGIEEVFAKPLLLDEKKISNITESEKTFLKAVPTIYQTLSLATSTALITKSLPDDSSNALTDIEDLLKSSVKSEKVKNLKAELVGAEEKVIAFQESKDEKNLSDAQQHLLNFLSLYFSK